ncbi:MAG: metallophosphoesterase [Opitutaceae bacterium]|nr:metallophosphoesterase [Opitutaceae bacterium]
MSLLPRRSFLRDAGTLGLGVAIAGPVFAGANSPASPASSSAPTSNPSRRRLLRAAHLTDIHVRSDLGAPAGMAAAIRHAQAQPDKPNVLLFGGDMIMDSLYCDKATAVAHWELWERIFAAEVKLPYRLCLGNHDIWGWSKHDTPEIEADPVYGKRLAMDRLGMKDRHYSFDLAGWHFVVLDSMERHTASAYGYTARIDDAQLWWLARDLAKTPATTPVCLLSHIPILSSCVFFDDDLVASGSWLVPGSWMHTDARRLKDLFKRHPNVKVCLSGHVHLADDVRYLGVRYLCNGAVCGGWWKGPYQEFAPAYALVDFYDDGSVENQLVAYGS